MGEKWTPPFIRGLFDFLKAPGWKGAGGMEMHRLQPSQIDKPKAAKFPRWIAEAQPRNDSLETNPFVGFTYATQTRLVFALHSS